MKDDEALKLIMSIKTDNIRQERELFKHVAILSSAILSIFVFNGNYSVGKYAKFGIIGLFIVIIISVILLFIILRIERRQAVKAQKQIQDIKELRSASIKTAFIGLLNKDNAVLTQKLFKEKSLLKIYTVVTALALNFYNDIKTGDDKIIKEVNKNKESKSLNWCFGLFSIINILLFVISLGVILFDILHII